MKCKLLETELCSFCWEVKETEQHLFLECQYVKNILNIFFDQDKNQIPRDYKKLSK